MGADFVSSTKGTQQSDAFFANACCFTGEVAQIIQFGATHFTNFVHLDFLDEWRVDRENTFNTDVVGNFAYRETFFVAVAGSMAPLLICI